MILRALLLLTVLMGPTGSTDTDSERGVYPAPSARQPDQAPAPVRPDPLIAWPELVAERSLRLGQRVRLNVQFHSWVVSWNPYLTRFGSGEFACLAAWSDEQLPWIREHYDAPAVRLFVRRGSVAERQLAEAALYRRFELVVDLREVLRDRPWCEIVAVRPLEKSLGEGSVIHASRAWTLIGNGTRSLALEELRRALAGNPPEHARKELERLLALCREPEELPGRIIPPDPRRIERRRR